MKKVLLLFFLCFVAVMSCFGVTATAAPQQLISGCKAAYLCDWRSGEVVFAKDAGKTFADRKHVQDHDVTALF